MPEHGEVHTWEDTKNMIAEGASGLDVSKTKWKSMRKVIALISKHIRSRCGLCEKHMDIRGNCPDCPLAQLWGMNCTNDNSRFKKIMYHINQAYEGSIEMFEDLISLEGKEIEINALESRLKTLRKESIPIRIKDVFYSKIENMFFEIRSKDHKCYGTGGFCEFYDDSKTDNGDRKVGYDYIQKNCIRVVDLDAQPDLWEKDHHGWWRVKKR